MDLELDPDLELTLPHDVRWDIDGTGARDGVDPQKVQHKYGSGAGSRPRVDPLYDLSWDIDGTGARDGMDLQKVQHKYGSGAGSRPRVDPPYDLSWDIDGTGARDGVDPQRHNTNMDLDLDLDPELNPHELRWDTDSATCPTESDLQANISKEQSDQ